MQPLHSAVSAESPKEVASRDWQHLMGAALLESLALVHKDKPSTPQCERSLLRESLLREAWLAFARFFPAEELRLSQTSIRAAAIIIIIIIIIATTFTSI